MFIISGASVMELAIQNGRLVTGREGVVVVDVVIYIFLERFPSLLTDCLPATPSAATPAPVPCALKRSRRRPLLEPVGLL